jgi:hypothetical protein
MGEIVIAAYRPKPGQEAALLDLTRDHVPYLRQLGLVTDRPALTLRNRNGVVLEIFEWRDGGTAAAHEMPEIHALWEKYAAVCDYTKLTELPEASDLFAMFTPIDF